MSRATLRPPPNSLEAEVSVIASLILFPDENWALIGNLLDEEAFYRREHRIIFRHVRAAVTAGEVIDPITLAERIAAAERSSDDWQMILITLTEEAIATKNAEHHAHLVRDRAMRRKLLQLAHQISDLAYTDSADAAYAKTLAMVSEAMQHQQMRTLEPLVAHLVRTVAAIEERRQGVYSGLPYGLADLDAVLNPMAPADLIFIGARPSMGKTTLALNIAQRIAQRGGTVYFRSAEMDTQSLVEKMLASDGPIDYNRILTGQLADDDWPRLTSSIAHLKPAMMYIDDTPAPTLVDIRADAMRVRQQTGEISLIVVDYLQLMESAEKNRGENRVSEITKITRGLKGIAKEMGCPLIALSQLSRDVEKRSPARPMMSDLRESGSIEQDADVILFLYSDQVYNPASAWGDLTEVIVAKQRKGPRNLTRHVLFDKSHSRFLNADPDEIRRIRAGIMDGQPDDAFTWKETHRKGAKD